MPPNELINLITYLYEGGHEVELLNYYKGVPLICKARFIDLNPKKAVLQVEAPFSICLDLENQTLILGEKLFEPIEARVLDFDIVKGLVELGEFVYRSSKYGSRRAVRVEPEKPHLIELVIGDQTLPAKLADISYGGAGVFVEGDVSLNMKPGDPLRLKLALPEGEFWAVGQVLKYEKVQDGDRLAVEFTEASAEQPILIRYITRRREEIRREVHELYRTRYQSELAGS